MYPRYHHPVGRLRPVLSVKPAVQPVTLDRLKRHCRVDFADDDEILQAYLDAAVQRIDGLSGRLGRCMVNQTWLFRSACWSSYGIRIPLPDVSSVSIAYQDSSDATQTLPSNMFRIVETVSVTVVEWTAAFTAPTLYERLDAVAVSAIAGYGVNPEDVPAPLRTAILMLASTWYENREAYSADSDHELPFAVSQLIAGYRRNTV